MRQANLARLTATLAMRITTVSALALASVLTVAHPAQAFPQNCSSWAIGEDGVENGAVGQCLSGTGTHRIAIHCSNDSDYYGDWKNTGSLITRRSSRECPLGHILRYKWQELRG
ncbi:hypothetical protein Pa4123_66210 [Phytohabitans aurantiacus]|uniref:Ricin B lectin domain-containing protein n=1 Tax=Phytohabitans aurantiacus TaxID=3016789 RepID=A0ABQ5R4L2_9ACTN|nr:hypothetical protein Pa4123_66210 [Phytohabitans aurantiacus]